MDRIIEIQSVEYQASDGTQWTIRPVLFPRYGNYFELCRYRLDHNGEGFEVEVVFTSTYLSTQGVKLAIQEERDQGFQHNIGDLEDLVQTVGLNQVKKIIEDYRDLLGQSLFVWIDPVNNIPVARLFTTTNGQQEIGTWEAR